VHLTHLVFDGKIAVAEPLTRRIAFLATEQEAEVLIAAGRIRPILSRKKKIKALHWIGQKLDSTLQAQLGKIPTLQISPPIDEMPGGKDIRSRVRYSHNHENAENPVNVWTLIPLAKWMQPIFLAAVTDCGGTRLLRRNTPKDR
jgi:hypothetical protein